MITEHLHNQTATFDLRLRVQKGWLNNPMIAALLKAAKERHIEYDK